MLMNIRSRKSSLQIRSSILHCRFVLQYYISKHAKITVYKTILHRYGESILTAAEVISKTCDTATLNNTAKGIPMHIKTLHDQTSVTVMQRSSAFIFSAPQISDIAYQTCSVPR